MSTEPVAINVAILALVNSVIALLVLTEVVTADVGAAITLIAGNALAVVVAVLTRKKVTPTNA